MSSFDAEITVMSATVGAPSAEALEAGVPPAIELGIIAGLALPFMNPQTQQPVVIPLGTLRFTLDREQAIEVFSSALKAAQDLPEKTASSGKLMIAQDMSAVTAAADHMKKVTGR